MSALSLVDRARGQDSSETGKELSVSDPVDSGTLSLHGGPRVITQNKVQPHTTHTVTLVLSGSSVHGSLIAP